MVVVNGKENKFHIRLARPSDWNRIKVIYHTYFLKDTIDDWTWWVAVDDNQRIVGISALCAGKHATIPAVAVIDRARGYGLQARLMKRAMWAARDMGYRCILSDTTDTIWSANNFIRLGFHIFNPSAPWRHARTIYWRKYL